MMQREPVNSRFFDFFESLEEGEVGLFFQTFLLVVLCEMAKHGERKFRSVRRKKRKGFCGTTGSKKRPKLTKEPDQDGLAGSKLEVSDNSDASESEELPMEVNVSASKLQNSSFSMYEEQEGILTRKKSINVGLGVPSVNCELFQFNGALYEQTDGVAMGSPLGPLLANVFMSSIEDTLERQRKLPSYYRRYVDDTLTVMPDLATATTFLHTLNSAHTSVKFTMEVEKNSKLPFLGTELLNHAPRIETKVYVKPTNTGLLLHYQSHVDNRYKRSLLKTMLDRAHRLSSSWAHFSDECDRLKKVFARLKYPGRLVNSTINTFLQSRIVGTQPTQTPKEPISIVRVVIPFKDQESANYVKKELKNLSMKVQTTVQPVFVSRKVSQDLKVREIKPQIVNQQRVVYQFQCDLCDAGYVGYTRGHLHTRVDGHKRKASSIYKHYHEQHSEVPKDLLKRFSILKKCSNKFDCLVNEMLFIRDLKPTLNVQSDSIRAKVFV